MRPSMRLAPTIALALLMAACGPDQLAPVTAGAFSDASPTGARQPSGNNASADRNCPGVPTKGQCNGSIAVTCASGVTDERDCAAEGASCVIDPAVGATCGAQQAAGTSPCGNDIDEIGYCLGGVAVWCDPETKVTETYDCPSEGLQCGVFTCAVEGAYCCTPEPTPDAAAPGMDASPPDAAPDASAATGCGNVDYDGICVGNTVRFCQDDKLVDAKCNPGTTCGVDVCDWGAWCCKP